MVETVAVFLIAYVSVGEPRVMETASQRSPALLQIWLPSHKEQTQSLDLQRTAFTFH
jgi:hypothetical protein